MIYARAPVSTTPPADSAPTDAPCGPCRGTGQVLSHLGGESKSVACSWCEGSGLRPPVEHDAQAAWRAKGGGDEGEEGPTTGGVDGSTSGPPPT